MKVDMQQLLNSILSKLTTPVAENGTGTSAEELQSLLIVVTKLLMSVQEQLDTVVQLRQYDRFFLQRFEMSENNIKFWTGFYSYGALMTSYNCMLEPEAAYNTGVLTILCLRKRQ